MKILIINGSPHAMGSTYIALSHMQKAITDLGAECTLIHIGGGYQSCRGCGYCKGGKPCVIGDIDGIAKLCAEADAIAIGAPVHYGEPCGNILSLLSRLCFSAKDSLRFKPAVSVAVCRRGGAVSACSAIDSFFKFSSMPIASGSYPAIFYESGKNGGTLDEEGLQNMRSAARALFYLATCMEIAKEQGVLPPADEEKIKTDIETLLR